MKKYLALLVLIGLLASCGKEDKSSSPEQGEEIQVDSEEFKKLSLEEQEKFRYEQEKKKAEIRLNLQKIDEYLSLPERDPNYWANMLNPQKSIEDTKDLIFGDFLHYKDREKVRDRIEEARKDLLKSSKEYIEEEEAEAKWMRSQNLTKEQRKKFEYIHKTIMSSRKKYYSFFETYLK